MTLTASRPKAPSGHQWGWNAVDGPDYRQRQGLAPGPCWWGIVVAMGGRRPDYQGGQAPTAAKHSMNMHVCSGSRGERKRESSGAHRVARWKLSKTERTYQGASSTGSEAARRTRSRMSRTRSGPG